MRSWSNPGCDLGAILGAPASSRLFRRHASANSRQDGGAPRVTSAAKAWTFSLQMCRRGAGPFRPFDAPARLDQQALLLEPLRRL
jgi:hypothetical protein